VEILFEYRYPWERSHNSPLGKRLLWGKALGQYRQTNKGPLPPGLKPQMRFEPETRMTVVVGVF